MSSGSSFSLVRATACGTWKAAIALSLLAFVLHCAPQVASERPKEQTALAKASPEPETSASAQSPDPVEVHLAELLASPACNRIDSATVFAPGFTASTQQLVTRLAEGPVALRQEKCEFKIADDCRPLGVGKLKPTQSCCTPDRPCPRDYPIDCYGSTEQYWFGDELEWALNLPEFVPALLRSHATAAVVQADVQLEYRLDLNTVAVSDCATATHLVAYARFGSLKVQAERGRHGDLKEPERVSVLPVPTGPVLIDMSIIPLRPIRGPTISAPSCMGEGTRRWGWTFDDPFFYKHDIEEPGRCTADCGPYKRCVAECLAGRYSSCSQQDLGFSDAYDRRVDEACSLGFMMSCSKHHPEFIRLLTSICEFGGEQSARVCGELSGLLQGEAAIKYAWLACNRGRFACDRAAELLAELNRKDDPRFREALNLACNWGDKIACCRLGAEQADEPNEKAEGLKLLRHYCADWTGLCCKELNKRGYAAPPRKFRPY